MALEFKLRDEANKSELFIDAQNEAGDRIMFFTVIDSQGIQYNFDVIQQDELIEFALFINQKLGFDFCDKYAINRQIEEDKKQINKQ